MFIAIPLETKPSWRRPPWMTLLLIAINCWVYFGWQVPEERAVERAAVQYAKTPLPEVELPAFVEYLQQRASATGKARDRARANAAERALEHGESAEQLYTVMWHDTSFRERLLAGRVITPDDERYDAWKAARADFTPREPERFNERWAQNHDAGAPFRPETWLTNTFMHGSGGHLFGNMLFLFLFGFTLELALGPLLYLGCYLIGGIGASALAAQVYAGMGGLGLGASGAVAALMGMYAVLYRLRRIPFFYMFLFYFNYARWPALVMLPVWMGFELLQHFMGGQHVAYMAHLGGLITGALVMAAVMAVRKVEVPDGLPSRTPADASRAVRQAELKPLVDKARQLTHSLRFADAARAWQEVAKQSPDDAAVLKHWFDCARHEPASDGFHAAARLIFKLPARDTATRRLQVDAYRSYLNTAKPGIRLSPGTMQALVRSFVAEAEWGDAGHLAQALSRMAPPPPGWPDTLDVLVNGLLKADKLEAARAWLPVLQRDAPNGSVTRWLSAQKTA